MPKPAPLFNFQYFSLYRPAEDEVIKDIDIRVARWTHIPPSHTEAMQVLRYECELLNHCLIGFYRPVFANIINFNSRFYLLTALSLSVLYYILQITKHMEAIGMS